MKCFNKILLSSVIAVSAYSSSFAMTSDSSATISDSPKMTPDENKPAYPTCQPAKATHDVELEKKLAEFKIFIGILITATNQGNAEIVQRLVTTLECTGISTGKPANLRVIDQEYGYNGWTLLQIAADQGHEEVVCILIRAGADPNAKVTDSDSYHHGWTALHIAAWRYRVFNSQKHANILKILCGAGANIYAKIDNPASEFHDWTAFAISCP